jgi:RNA polymerase sigma factor (sigma-70 family)
MGFLPVLLALKDRQPRGGDGDEDVRRLSHLLEDFRPRLRWMAGGELADEDAIFNLACFSISNGAWRFNGGSEGEARRYCWQTVNRGAVDAYRRAGGRWMYKVSARNDAVEEDDLFGAEPCGITSGGEAEAQPEADNQRQEERERVREAVRRLNAADRELVESIGIRGERIRDLADRLGVRENTLTQRWRRACARLRKLLTAEEGTGAALLSS